MICWDIDPACTCFFLLPFSADCSWHSSQTVWNVGPAKWRGHRGVWTLCWPRKTCAVYCTLPASFTMHVLMWELVKGQSGFMQHFIRYRNSNQRKITLKWCLPLFFYLQRHSPFLCFPQTTSRMLPPCWRVRSCNIGSASGSCSGIVHSTQTTLST